jgi:protein O-GlcNAc transferase
MLGSLFRRSSRDRAEQLIAAGNRAENEGRLSEACQLYRRAVDAQPRHAGARLNLGVGLEAAGDLAGARECYEKALEIEPSNAAASYNLGKLHYTQGAHAEAVRRLTAALDARADFPQASIVRGHARYALGELEAAALDLAAGLHRLPEDEGARRALAAVRASLAVKEALEHHAAGRRPDAEAGYRAVLHEQPDHAAALHLLGVMAYEDGRHGEAAALVERSLHAHGANAHAHFSLGRIREAQGSADDALACYRAALALAPDHVDALCRVGALLQARGRSAEALEPLRRALALDPQRADTHFALAIAERDLEHLDQAIAAFASGLELAPATVDAHFALGDVLRAAGRKDEALASLRRALELDPEHVKARWSSAMTELPLLFGVGEDPQATRARFAAALDGLDRWFDDTRVHKGAEAVGTNQPFALAYQEADNRELLERYGALCARLMAHWQRSSAIPPPTARRRRPIRIGIVSAYLRHHSVWSAITKGWFARLDPRRCTLLAFHLGTLEDQQTAVARARAAHYEGGRKDLAAWVEAIQAQEPDVLIYPDVGMEPMSALLASLRLAPVQAASWGHPETTGLPTIDYYLSAEDLEPAGAQAHYREQLVTLPQLGCCFERPAFPPALDASLPDGPLLICPGVPFKYAPQLDWILVEIVRRLGRGRLVFFSHRHGGLSRRLADRLRAAFRSGGVDYDRHVSFVPWQTAAGFLGCLRRADLYLDTIGFSGFNTALFAVEAGLPIVTREGRFLRGRLAGGILKRLEMQELVAPTDEAYIELAVTLTQDAARRRGGAGAAPPPPPPRPPGAAPPPPPPPPPPRLYEDASAVVALEDFLERVC